MDFRSLNVKDFMDNYGGMDILKKYVPQIAKPLMIRPFYKKTCGEVFDLCMSKKLVTEEQAQKVIDAVEAL